MPQSFVAEVVLAHGDLPLAPTIAAIPEAIVAEESIRPPTDSAVPAVLFRVTGVDFAAFESALADDHTVDSWRAAMDLGDARMYRVQLSPATRFVTPTLSDLGIHVVFTRSVGTGWRFKLETADRDTLGEFWEYCREAGIQFELEKIHASGSQPVDDRSDVRTALTDRQREIARVVARMGYYEQDGACAEAVADELGIAPSTLSTHLRRINAKLYRALFTDEREPQ